MTNFTRRATRIGAILAILQRHQGQQVSVTELVRGIGQKKPASARRMTSRDLDTLAKTTRDVRLIHTGSGRPRLWGASFVPPRADAVVELITTAMAMESLLEVQFIGDGTNLVTVQPVLLDPTRKLFCLRIRGLKTQLVIVSMNTLSGVKLTMGKLESNSEDFFLTHPTLVPLSSSIKEFAG